MRLAMLWPCTTSMALRVVIRVAGILLTLMTGRRTCGFLRTPRPRGLPRVARVDQCLYLQRLWRLCEFEPDLKNGDSG
jgi:hypothetical protein